MPTIHDEGLLPRGKERLGLLALTLLAFCTAVNANVLGPLLPFLAGEGLGVDAEALGWLLSATNLASAAGALVAGPVVDRVGRLRPMLLGMGVMALALAGHALAATFPVLLALRIVSGLASGVAFTSASAAVADLVPYRRLGGAMGLFSAGIFLAVTVGLPAAVAMARSGAGGWRPFFLGLAALAALAAAACLVLPRDLGRHGATGGGILLVLRQPAVVPVLLAVMLSVGAFFATVQYAGAWLDDSRLIRKEAQAPLWATLGVLSALGSIILSRLSDRFGRRTFLLVTTAGLAICIGLLGRVQSLTGLAVVGVPLALLGAGRTGPAQALLAELVPQALRGSMMGVRAAAVTVGMALYGVVAGLVVQARGYHDFLLVTVVTLVVAYFLLRSFVRRDL